MKKLKIGVIYGGMSSEHDISVISGNAVINNLNKKKYDIYPIFINKDGDWYYDDIKIDNIIKHLKELDLIFPVLHGKYGEDGSIQGLFELFKIKYVGCDILSSSIAMDKIYAKKIFDCANIKNSKSIFIKKYDNKYIFVDEKFNETEDSLNNIISLILNKLKFPLFIKPSNSGSSIGINKAYNKKELKEYIKYASLYDNKILVEEEIKGREIECAVIGISDVKVSCLGEIKTSNDFYSYDAKYISDSKLIIPANIDSKLEEDIKNTAIKAYKAISCKGLARVDFFITDNDIYINEINTLPGFTSISMYPKLWENSGLSFSSLLDKIINLSIQKK